MKSLKIVVMCLVVLVVFTACSKSTVKPCCSEKPTSSDTENISSNNLRDGDIYGTGDDDRDGGDKKKKQVVAK